MQTTVLNWVSVIFSATMCGFLLIIACLLYSVCDKLDDVLEYLDDKYEEEEHPYLLANRHVQPEITEEQAAKGWHYCPEWDGLVVHPGVPEWDACVCKVPGKTNDYAHQGE